MLPAGSPASVMPRARDALAPPAAHAPGAVYVMTNAVDANAIAVFTRAADGTLTAAGRCSTGGHGSGVGRTLPPDPLGSQNALLLVGPWLCAVNAGSDTISVLRIQPHALEVVAVVPSGGAYPVSLTVHHDRLYVLNAAGAGSLVGFTLAPDGQLTPLAGATRSLAAATPADGSQPHILESPAQVGFTPDGTALVVTDKGGVSGMGRILVFPLGPDRLPAAQPTTTHTAGAVPFGFAFDAHGHLLVVDAGGGTVTAYQIGSDGRLTPHSTTESQQAASCWIVTTPDGRYAYTDNAGSHSISGFRIAADGQLAPLTPGGPTASAGAGATPIDLALSRDGRFLYTLNTGHGTVGIFEVGIDGGLRALGAVDAVPRVGGAQGIAAC